MIPLKELIKKETQEVLKNKPSNKKKAALLWFITEIIQIIYIVMGGIMLLWLYAPYNLITKTILTTISTIIIYDIFKSFVYVRWILWKQSI